MTHPGGHTAAETHGPREGPGRREARTRDLRLWVRIVTPLIIAGLTLGAVLDYQRSSQVSLAHFAEKQQFLASQAADRLAEVFREVDKFLVLLSTVKDVAALDGADAPRSLTSAVAQLSENGALLAFRRSADRKLLVASSRPDASLTALLDHGQRCNAQFEMCVYGPLPSTLAPSGWVLMATMGMTEAEAQRAGSDALAKNASGGGIIGIVLDWGALQGVIARVSKLSAETYSWVLDHEGRLVMHPEHRDQLGKDALKRGDACAKCHTDFALHRRMASGEAGVGMIQAVGHEEKLVVFTPFRVGSALWSLAVATPASLADVGRPRDMVSIFVFTGAIILVLVAGALLLDREASRRIRAVDRFNRELEQMVAQRTEQIEALYHRLSSLQAHHTRLERTAVAGEMASILAHEVRTPLNALSINAQLMARMLRRPDGGDRERVLEVLGTLDGEIQRLNNLLEDHLLVLVRNRPVVLKPLCANDVALDSIRFMAPEADRKGVRLVYRPGKALPRVHADEPRLRQVLLNLILNAVQALAQGGEVALDTLQEGNNVVMRVKDDGPGIEGPAGDLDQVFKPFHTTKPEGTGLGLAICARLVKEMRGRIEVSSVPGEGACFSVMLPVAKEEPRCP